MADDGLEPSIAKAIAADYLRTRLGRSRPLAEPKAVLVAGQPGAGKTALVAATMAELREQGGYVRVDADRARESLPAHGHREVGDDPAAISASTQKAAGQVAGEVRAIAIEQRRNLVEEGTFRDAQGAARYIDALHTNGYEAEMRVMAVPFEESRLGTYQRFESQQAAGIEAARFVSDDYQKQAYDSLRDTVAHASSYADRLTIHTRDGQQVHDTLNERGRTAVEALDEHRQIRSSEQRTALAQGWDEVAAMAAQRNASADWQARIEQHQARAHFTMQADKGAGDAYREQAGEDASRRSEALARVHGRRLADAMRDQSPKEAMAEHPELASAYSTLASARAFAAAKLDPAQQQAFVQRTADKVAADLASGRHPPQVDLKAVQAQVQGHDGPER